MKLGIFDDPMLSGESMEVFGLHIIRILLIWTNHVTFGWVVKTKKAQDI